MRKWNVEMDLQSRRGSGDELQNSEKKRAGKIRKKRGKGSSNRNRRSKAGKVKN